MKFLKQLFDFYINSSIHVALAVFSLAWITLIEFHISYDEAVLYFIFYATISGYNFVKYFGLAKFHHIQLATWLKLIQILSFISFLLMCFYGYQLNINTFIFIGCLAVLTFLYAMPIFSSGDHSLRNVTGIKVYIIALVWAGVTVFLPLIQADSLIVIDSILTGVQRFIFVIVLMLPFEIRDLKYDNSNLGTIPQKIGVMNAKILGITMLFVFFLMEFFKGETSLSSTIIHLIMSIITLVFLMFSKLEQNKYYCSFWVESLPIMWLLLVLLT